MPRENPALLIISSTVLNTGEVTGKKNGGPTVSKGQWHMETTTNRGMMGMPEIAVATCLPSATYTYTTSSIPAISCEKGINMTARHCADEQIKA